MADFDFDDESSADGVAGTPEGDGDFETDNLASTGETSAGGQVQPGQAERVPKAPESGLERVIDEISTGKILP